uniref:Uncharacterized protein n=1 Tax=Anguilla anguilla TaxID=7936 RepID=A0A0E9XBW0_ANGAN
MSLMASDRIWNMTITTVAGSPTGCCTTGLHRPGYGRVQSNKYLHFITSE